MSLIILALLIVLFLATIFFLFKKKKTRKKIFQPLFQGHSLTEAEEIFYSSDLGPKMTKKLLEVLYQEGSFEGLKKYLFQELSPVQKTLEGKIYFPFVGLFIGMNGVGKTTTIGKLAHRFQEEGKKGVLIAGDTFRAGAKDQLKFWAEKTQSHFIEGDSGDDPATVVYKGVDFFLKNQLDYCLIDTAGRLQNNENLIAELKKIKKVMTKLLPQLKTHSFLVIDAMNGLHALRQIKSFHEDIGITSAIYTKVDGSSKAGSLISLLGDFKIPVAYIGMGEGLKDLTRFHLKSYLDQLF